MNCPQCNELMPDGTKFCMNCGLKITTPPTTAPTPIQGTPTQPNHPGNAQPNYPQPTQLNNHQTNYQQSNIQPPSYQQPVAPSYPQPNYPQPNQPNYQQPNYQQPFPQAGQPNFEANYQQQNYQQPNYQQQPNQQPNYQQPNYQQPGQMVPYNSQVPSLPIGQALSPLPGGLIPSYNQHQAAGERNFLERIASKIPGYRGYVEKESRRDVDKLHREHLAVLLSQLKPQLNNVIRELSDNRRLFEVGPIEKALQKLDKVENRIRYASYGYAGFFDAVKIQEDQLDQLYHFDLALVEDVENVKMHVQKLLSQFADARALKTAAQELIAAIDDLDAKFNQRYQAIENPGWSPY